MEPRKPEGFSELELYTSAGIAISSDRDATRHYHWFAQFESRCRLQTNREFLHSLSAWQRGFRLLCEPFMPGQVFDLHDQSGEDQRSPQSYATEYRLLTIGSAVRMSKRAMDSILDGYYSEAFTMYRVIIESWKRAAYVRRAPDEVERFLPKEDWLHPKFEITGRHGKTPERGDWDRVFPLEDDGEKSLDRMMLEQATNGMKYLNNFAHPTVESMTSIMGVKPEGLDRFDLRLAPEFSRNHADKAIRLAILCLDLLLHEINLLPDTDEGWRERFYGWMKVVAGLGDSEREAPA